MRILIPLTLLLAGCGSSLDIANADEQYNQLEREGAPDVRLCPLAKQGLEMARKISEDAKAPSDAGNAVFFWSQRVSETCPKGA